MHFSIVLTWLKTMKAVNVDESWLVILYSFLTHALLDGLRHTFGIIAPDLIVKRNFIRVSIGLVATIFETSFKISAPIGIFLYILYICTTVFLSAKFVAKFCTHHLNISLQTFHFMNREQEKISLTQVMSV